MQSTRGMHDILPGEIEYWQYIYEVALKELSVANYAEIRTPIMEDTSLYLRSIGECTDIVSKEMYSFLDKGGRNLTLRPEGTAGVARSIIQNNLCKHNSIQKLWYFSPMFRYERPQYGRQRQFHQLGIECYGSNHPAIDAQIIYLAKNILDKLHCDNYSIELNSIGSLDDRKKYEVKLKDYLYTYYQDLTPELQHCFHNNTIKLLDSKDTYIQELLSEGPQLTEVVNSTSLKHFETVKNYLSEMNVQYKISTQMVRGLDYYNDTVFEFKTNQLGTQDTICGGGRYDMLTHQLGSKTIPAIGWGIGIERLLLLIKKNLILDNCSLYFYIASQGDKSIAYALSLVPILQKNNIKYEIDVSNSTFQKQIKKAYKKNAIACILIGDDEISSNSITLKWLNEYKQEKYSQQDFITMIRTRSLR